MIVRRPSRISPAWASAASASRRGPARREARAADHRASARDETPGRRPRGRGGSRCRTTSALAEGGPTRCRRRRARVLRAVPQGRRVLWALLGAVDGVRPDFFTRRPAEELARRRGGERRAPSPRPETAMPRGLLDAVGAEDGVRGDRRRVRLGRARVRYRRLAGADRVPFDLLGEDPVDLLKRVAASARGRRGARRSSLARRHARTRLDRRRRSGPVPLRAGRPPRSLPSSGWARPARGSSTT